MIRYADINISKGASTKIYFISSLRYSPLYYRRDNRLGSGSLSIVNCHENKRIAYPTLDF